jgi:hypothetical protein
MILFAERVGQDTAPAASAYALSNKVTSHKISSSVRTASVVKCSCDDEHVIYSNANQHKRELLQQHSAVSFSTHTVSINKRGTIRRSLYAHTAAATAVVVTPVLMVTHQLQRCERDAERRAQTVCNSATERHNQYTASANSHAASHTVPASKR